MTRDGFTPWPAAVAADYRRRGIWQGITLDRLLTDQARRLPDKPVVIDRERTWTYSALNAEAERWAAGLRERGLGPGDSLVLQMPNRGEFFVVLFACFRLGVAPVLALPGHRRLEIEHFCRTVDAKAYVGVDRHERFDFRALAAELRDAGAVEHAIILGEAGDCTAFDSVFAEPVDLPDRDASEVALFQLSGGTTGTPKLIARTHDDYFYSVRTSAIVCALDHRSVYLAVLPLAHNFPLSSPGTLGTFWAGGTVVVAPSPAPETVFELIERHRVTMTAAVPPVAQLWLEAKGHSQHSLASLNVLQVGGAKLSPAVAERIGPAFGCTLQQVFGMAEGLVNYTRLTDPAERIIHTQGKPMSSADEVRVVDDEDRDVPIGEVGHLLTRGPYTIRGYYKAPAHNAKSFTADGFYRTGDRVRLTEDGYLIVAGRAKDQINRGGEKIAAEEVENQLRAHPAVHDAAVVAIPDDYLGERAWAFVVLRADRAPATKSRDIRQYLREAGLATFKLPDQVAFIDALPKTAFGKVDKNALRDRARQSDAQEPVSA